MNDLLTDLTDFRDLRYSDIENVYQAVKLDQTPMYVLGIMIALVFTLFNLVKITQEDLFKRGETALDIGSFVNILKQKWYFIMIITLMPVGFSLFEGFIGWVGEFYIEEIGKPDASIYQSLKKQAELLVQKESASNLFLDPGEFILDAIDYSLVFSLQPVIVFYIESAYSSALVFRFFFHAAVELMGMIAVASLLNPQTEKFFYNWIKALLISYLMIPMCLFANGFTDAIYEAMLLTEVYSWIFPLLIMIAALKTVVFTAAPIVLFRVL